MGKADGSYQLHPECRGIAGIPDDEVVTRFALQHLGDRVTTNGGLDSILNIRNVDTVASGGVAIDGVVQVGLPDDAEETEIAGHP